MEFYQKRLRSTWLSTKRPVITDIPTNKGQLLGRINDFDGGATSRWLTGLGPRAVWRSLRDAVTGHVIHCVSDRPFAALTRDLTLALKLMGWMSQRQVTWYWWDQPWDRLLPGLEEPRKEHLNGGWAVPGVLEVHVYRRQEAHKVMLHEMIHALNLDVPTESIQAPLASLEADLGRRLWPHLGEAFTELYAEWLWCIVLDRPWADQVACSEGQAAAIWARIRTSKKDEDTNVFAYYILKWVLMGHAADVFVSPRASVPLWYSWWLAAKPRLEELAAGATEMNQKELRMNMTCL